MIFMADMVGVWSFPGFLYLKVGNYAIKASGTIYLGRLAATYLQYLENFIFIY